MTYAEKLKSPHWQKKRLEILEAREWKCEACKDKSTPLHVHHTFYERGKMPWEYPDWALQVLCEDCHDYHQSMMEYAHEILASEPNLIASICYAADAVTPILLADMLERYCRDIHHAYCNGLGAVKKASRK